VSPVSANVNGTSLSSRTFFYCVRAGCVWMEHPPVFVTETIRLFQCRPNAPEPLRSWREHFPSVSDIRYRMTFGAGSLGCLDKAGAVPERVFIFTGAVGCFLNSAPAWPAVANRAGMSVVTKAPMLPGTLGSEVVATCLQTGPCLPNSPLLGLLSSSGASRGRGVASNPAYLSKLPMVCSSCNTTFEAHRGSVAVGAWLEGPLPGWLRGAAGLQTRSVVESARRLYTLRAG